MMTAIGAAIGLAIAIPDARGRLVRRNRISATVGTNNATAK